MEVSASENSRVNGPESSKVPLIVLLNVKVVSFPNSVSAQPPPLTRRIGEARQLSTLNTKMAEFNDRMWRRFY